MEMISKYLSVEREVEHLKEALKQKKNELVALEPATKQILEKLPTRALPINLRPDDIDRFGQSGTLKLMIEKRPKHFTRASVLESVKMEIRKLVTNDEQKVEAISSDIITNIWQQRGTVVKEIITRKVQKQ